MRKCIWSLLVCLAGPALALPGAVTGQVDLVSRYIWRGFDQLPGNHAAIQPSLTIDLGASGLALGVWSSFALAHRETFKHSDEIDVTLSYAFKVPEGWELTAGVTHYCYWFADDFTFKDNISQEVCATVAATGLPLSPTLSVYYDVHLGSGLYVTLGGSHVLKLSERASMEVGGLIGFNSRQYIDKTGFSDIDLYASMPLALGRLILTASLNVMVPLLDEVNEDVEIWIGLSAVL